MCIGPSNAILVFMNVVVGGGSVIGRVAALVKWVIGTRVYILYCCIQCIL